MDIGLVLHSALILGAKLCLPPLLAALVAGTLLAVFQAVTQINDSALAFLPKLLATFVAASLAGPFMLRSLIDFMHGILDAMIATGGQ
jgi:flagellar biosynthetic protein FliQ